MIGWPADTLPNTSIGTTWVICLTGTDRSKYINDRFYFILLKVTLIL